MQISKAGLALIEEFEGYERRLPDGRCEAYPDPKTGGDPWTIGFGHTGPEVVRGLVWTPHQALAALARDVAHAERLVNAVVKVPLTQGQFDALTSIVFNVGHGNKDRDGIIRLKSGAHSTLLRKLNAGDYDGASAEFDRWISKGSPVEAGLRRRRAAERALFEDRP